MANTRLAAVIGQFLRMARQTGVGVTDGELLDRFLCRRDEAAFETLLWRHGPMVLRTCRRMLRHDQEAEDAFQATFLVLFRKAHAITQRGSLAGWLYQVAYRTALKASAQARRLKSTQPLTFEPLAPEANLAEAWREIQPILDEELNRLPEKYRAPLVLHYLQGKTKEQVARELSWREGTVSGRLARGREMLRSRLSGRGLTASATTLAAILTQNAVAEEVPVLLVSSTLKAVAALSFGTAAAASLQATLIAEQVCKAMFMTKLKIAAAIVLGIGLVSSGAATLGRYTFAAREATADQPGRSSSGENQAASRLKENGKLTDQYGDPLPPGAIARMGTVRLRHGGDGGLMAAAISPDGRVIASTGIDGLRLWDAASGQELFRFNPPISDTDWKSALLFSRKGDWLAMRLHAEIFIVGLSPPRLLRQFAVRKNESWFCPMAISPDERMLATAESYSENSNIPEHIGVTIWDIQTGTEVRRIDDKRQASFLAFALGGKTVVSAGLFDQTIRLYDVEHGNVRRSLTVPGNELRSFAVSPDGKLLVSSAMLDGRKLDKFRVWDLESGKQVRELEVENAGFRGRPLAFLPDSRLLEGQNVWDLKTGRATRKFHERIEGDVSVSADSKTLALFRPRANFIRLFDVPSGKERPLPSGHGNDPIAVAFSPDGRQLLSASQYERDLRIWETPTGRQLGTWRGTPVEVRGDAPNQVLGRSDDFFEKGPFSIAFSPDGKTVAAGVGWKGAIYVWDRSNGKEIRYFRTPHVRAECLAFSPDGRILASSYRYDRQVCVWDPATGKMVRSLQGPKGQLKELAFSANGEELICVSGDSSWEMPPPLLYGPHDVPHVAIHCWNTATWQKSISHRSEEQLVDAIAISRDGKSIAVQSEKARRNLPPIVRVGVAAGKRFIRLETPDWPWAPGGLAFSPDGKLLAYGTVDDEVHVMELATQRQCFRFPGHRSYVRRVAFSPDGNVLASASSDTTLLVWDLRDRSNKR